MRANVHFLAVFALTVIFPGSAGAADKPKFYDEVLAVDARSITVYRSPTKEAKYAVSATTKVFVDSKLAKIEDVKPGMKATVYHKANSDEATSISARSVR